MARISIFDCGMWQTPYKKHTFRGPLRGTQMGLLACAVAILLTGVVIGRMSARSSALEDVYLRETEPSPSLSVNAAGAVPRERPTLDHVLHTTTPTAPREEPQRRPRKEKPPSNLIDGYGSGSRHTVITPGNDGGGGDAYDADSMQYASMEAEVVRLVNAERRKHGCSTPARGPAPGGVRPRALGRDGVEQAVPAQLSRRRLPWERMGAAGYSDGGAETIARGYQTAEAVVRGWMAGRSDRSTLLDCRLVATGVGVSTGEGGPWWTEDFGYS